MQADADCFNDRFNGPLLQHFSSLIENPNRDFLVHSEDYTSAGRYSLLHTA
jgi:hypothetical protein